MLLPESAEFLYILLTSKRSKSFLAVRCVDTVCPLVGRISKRVLPKLPLITPGEEVAPQKMGRVKCSSGTAAAAMLLLMRVVGARNTWT